jgi:zinc and cadmium transporter
MTTIYLYTFASVALVSMISLIGVFALSLKTDVLQKYIFVFMSVAVGALLGDAFIHLIPEALGRSSNTTITSILVIGGILIFFTLEKFLHWHHHGEDSEEVGIHPVGQLVLLSDGVHNFLDGMIIGASFMASVPIGIATTFAVIVHEIPQEIGDFAVLLHSGYTKQRALRLNFLSALTAFLGAIVFFVLGEIAESSYLYFIPITAGGFIYIAVADLIPELHKTTGIKHSVFQLVAVVLGVLAMIALTFLE